MEFFCLFVKIKLTLCWIGFSRRRSTFMILHAMTASQAGLVSFFDFIVGANEQMLLGSGEGLQEGEEYDDVDFPALLRENKDRTVELCE